MQLYLPFPRRCILLYWYSPQRRRKVTATALFVESETAHTPVTPKKRIKKVHKAVPVVTPSTSSNPAAASATTTMSSKKPIIATKQQSTPPDNWQSTYSLVEELRADRAAPCDHSGAEALPEHSKDFNFQVLLSLMLSSQTKDAVVALTIRSMQQDQVCSVEAIANMTPEKLNSYIVRTD
jgi:hypothetical protein